MADEIAIPYFWPSTALSSCCPSQNTWKITTSFTLTLASGGTQINPLTAQAITLELGQLMRIDNVYPVVSLITLPHMSVHMPFIYFVEIVYPTHVQGRHRRRDGTLCDEIIPVAIPQVRQQGEEMARQATACLVPPTTSPYAEVWQTALKIT